MFQTHFLITFESILRKTRHCRSSLNRLGEERNSWSIGVRLKKLLRPTERLKGICKVVYLNEFRNVLKQSKNIIIGTPTIPAKI